MTETKIMIVDDEEDIRELVQIMLSREGIEVLKAENGERGLEMLEEVNPDLILLDINMPGLNGWETLEEMEAKGFTKESPVVMFTIEDLTFVKMLREDIEGLVGYIEKPFDREELMELIEKYVGRMKEIQELRKRIEESPEGGESLAKAFEAWSRSMMIHERFLEKLNEMKESTTDERRLARIKNMKKGEENTIRHLKQKKNEILRTTGLEDEDFSDLSDL